MKNSNNIDIDEKWQYWINRGETYRESTKNDILQICAFWQFLGFSRKNSNKNEFLSLLLLSLYAFFACFFFFFILLEKTIFLHTKE